MQAKSKVLRMEAQLQQQRELQASSLRAMLAGVHPLAMGFLDLKARLG